MGSVAEYVTAVAALIALQFLYYTPSLGAVFSPYTRHLVFDSPLSLLSFIVVGMAIVTRIVVTATKERSGLIDPKKWLFDPDTGEYYPITNSRGSMTVYRERDYGKRSVDWFHRAEEAEKAAFNNVIFGFLIFGLTKYLEFSAVLSRPVAMMGGLFGIFGIWLGVWRWAIAERGRWEMVGPRPVRQQTPLEPLYDPRQSAGQPDLRDIDRRLRGRDDGNPLIDPETGKERNLDY